MVQNGISMAVIVIKLVRLFALIALLLSSAQPHFHLLLILHFVRHVAHVLLLCLARVAAGIALSLGEVRQKKSIYYKL